MENSSELYYQKLENTTNPGAILAGMYCSLYNVEPTRSEIISMNRLIKVFGRFNVFFGILDMAGGYPDKVDNMYTLLFAICKRKFEAAHAGAFVNSYESLDRVIDKIQLEAEKLRKKKIKIPSSEGLANNGQQRK